MPSRRGPVGSSAAMAVADPSQVAEVRRAVAEMCRSVGLDQNEEGRAGIVATEAATNVVKHGRGGEVVLSPLQRGEAVGIEVLALDRGPGIPEAVARAGARSTVGTRGTGFEAIRRQSTEIDLYTLPGQGTALLSRILARRPAPDLARSRGAVRRQAGRERVRRSVELRGAAGRGPHRRGRRPGTRAARP